MGSGIAQNRLPTTEDRAISSHEEQPTNDPQAEESRPVESAEETAFAVGLGDEPSSPPTESTGSPEASADETAAPPIEEATIAPQDDDTPKEDVGDDEESPAPAAEKKGPLDWAHETSGHRIENELSKIETEVRGILADRDTRRKRKLTGTRRWQELEDDIITWRFGGKIDEPSLDRLNELISRRRYLFTRLNFLAGTRPTWNS